MKKSRMAKFAGAGLAVVALMPVAAQPAMAAPSVKKPSACKAASTCGETTSGAATAKAPKIAPISSETAYNNKQLDMYAKWLVADVVTTDEWTADGISAHLALATLGKTLAGIAALKAPAGSDPATFYALASTSSDFAYTASDDYAYGDDMQGLARYTVIRSHLGELLASINAGIGSNYALPA